MPFYEIKYKNGGIRRGEFKDLKEAHEFAKKNNCYGLKYKINEWEMQEDYLFDKANDREAWKIIIYFLLISASPLIIDLIFDLIRKIF